MWRWISILALAGGCSWLNPFDPLRPVDEDAGMLDAGMDAGPELDSGLDAGPLDAGPFDAGMPDAGPIPPESNCEDGMDNDGDGFTDCDDLDCASDTETCCRGGSERDLDFAGTFGENGWELQPSGILPPGREDEDQVLVDMDATMFTALVSSTCVSLAQGARFSLRVQSRDPEHESCPSPTEPCSDYKAFKLTPEPTLIGGSLLFDDLSVRVHPNGVVQMSQANRPIPGVMSFDYEGAEPFFIDVSISPGLDEVGDPALRVRVEVRDSGMVREIYDGTPIRLVDLIRDGSLCAEVPGLYYAIEGRDDGVAVLEVEERVEECLNPNQFQPSSNVPLVSGPPYDDLDVVSLGFEPETEPFDWMGTWADEGLMSPALLRIGDGASARWHVLASSSNDQPENETTARVGFAIGHASVLGTNWNTVGNWSSSVTPRVGEQPPSCIGDESCSTISTRDATVAEFGGGLLFVWAQETAVLSGQYELWQGELSRDVSGGPIMGAGMLFEEEACQSIRHPALLPRSGADNQYYLLYSCIPESGAATIRAVVVRDDECGAQLCVEERDSFLVLDQALAKTSAEVTQPEVVADGSSYRLWFLSQWSRGERAVGLAIGEEPGRGRTPCSGPTRRTPCSPRTIR